MSTELSISLANEINASHKKIIDGSNRVKDTLIETLSEVIKCGHLLIEAKETVGHGSWMRWLENNFVGHYNAAERYMRCARSNSQHAVNLQDFSSVRQLLIACGAIAEPSGHGHQTLHVPPNFFSQITKGITDFKLIWQKGLKENPIEKWEPDVRDQMKDQLKPMIEDLNELYSRL